MQRKCRHSDIEYIKIKQRTIAAVIKGGWKDPKLHTKYEKQANRLKIHGLSAVERKETDITRPLARLWRTKRGWERKLFILRYWNWCCDPDEYIWLNLNFAPYKGVQDILGYWIPQRGFPIIFKELNSSLCQWNLDSVFQSFSRIPDFLSCCLDSKAQPRFSAKFEIRYESLKSKFS